MILGLKEYILISFLYSQNFNFFNVYFRVFVLLFDLRWGERVSKEITYN